MDSNVSRANIARITTHIGWGLAKWPNAAGFEPVIRRFDSCTPCPNSTHELNRVDEIDIANEQAELFLASALANQRKAAARAVEPPGECLNCGADLYTSTRRFCDSDCAEDWQHRNRVRQKQGSQP